MKNKVFPVALLIVFFNLISGCSYISSSLNQNDLLTAEEHNNLGVAYEKEGKYKLALREYKRAVQIDNTMVTPLVNTGNVYYKQENYKKAEKYYLKALGIDNRNIIAANNLGNVYLKKGSGYEKGIEHLVNSLPPPEIAPAYALDTLAMLYEGVGNKDKAEELLLLACNNAGDEEDLKSEISSHLEDISGKRCE